MPIAEDLKTGISKKKVLIVDDDKGMVKMIERLLIIQKDFEIDYAYDGFIAGQKFETFKPDLIIVDLKMPKVDGYELCANIRRDPQGKNVKIIVISGEIDEEISIKLKRLGVDQYLSKPFVGKDLIGKVQNLLSINTEQRN